MRSNTQPSPPKAIYPVPVAPNRRLGPHLPTRPSRRALFLAVYLGFCLSLLWGATKAYWLLTADVPLSQSPSIWDHYFPKIRRSGLSDRKIRRDDRQFDLLLLGGSVLEPNWGTIEAELRQRLETVAPGRFRIYNLAEAGFTSRDSRVQYDHFTGNRFDLVLVYEGINDVRMNCCPPEEFHDDYSHFPRYGLMMQRLDAGTLSLPAAVVDRFRSVASTLPLGTADPQLVDFAASPQSPRTLKENLETIAQAAIARGDPLLLLTYAWYIPDDYTPERFRDGTLDYSHEAPYTCGAEMWGRPEHVANAMRLQNEAIREIVRSHPEVRFVDQSELLPKNGDTFCDPCHLTTAGCQRFVDNIWPEIERALRASPAWK